MRTQHSKEKPFVCDVDGCRYKTGDSSALASKGCFCWIVRGRENGVLTIIVLVVVWYDGGEWYYYSVVRCDVRT